MSPIAGLGASLPPELRDAPRADREAYQAAAGFERMLLGELTKTMKLGGDSAEASPVDLSSTLADTLAANGGIGLTRQLFETLRAGS